MMEKNYEKNPEKANYIKENLLKKYPEIFEKYQISEASLSRMQVCNLAEFLIAEHPEKYDKTAGTRMDYENDEDLQKIYAIIDKRKNTAVFINTNENGKVPEGEFGTYDLEHHTFDASEQIKENIKKSIRELANNTLTEKEIEEMTNEISPKNLDDMDKIATMGERNIRERVRKAVDQKIDEKNEENGKTKEDREKLESKKSSLDNKEQEKEKEEEVKSSKLPEHVVKYCLMTGIAVPKAVIDTKASEAADKIDEPRINRNGGDVTIIKTRDDSKQTDKYLVFQDGKLIIPGNRDDKIDKVVGERMQHTKDGSMIKPLEIDDEEQYFEYTDSQGLVIKEKLEENMNLSVEDLEAYKKKAKENLEKFSDELYKIEETPFLSDAEKDKLYIQANERFNVNNEKIGKQFNIDISDVKEINLATDERTQNQVDKEQDEPEAWEVPGKREIGE